jgi:predicted aconitase with swiveling domain
MKQAAQGEILVPGAAGEGGALVLTAPISFWGGVDPKSGRIVDVRHPQYGEAISGKVLFLPGTIGSSSASAVLMELVHSGHAPAAIVLHEPDAILLLGLIVAAAAIPAPFSSLPKDSHVSKRKNKAKVALRGRLTAPNGHKIDHSWKPCHQRQHLAEIPLTQVCVVHNGCKVGSQLDKQIKSHG